MFKVFTVFGSILFGMGMFATSSYAGTMFNVTGSGGSNSSYSFSQDGIQFTATAFDQNGNSQNVHQSSGGLGVFIGGSDSRTIDGNGPDETLKLTFNVPVELISILFGAVDSNDQYKLLVDGNIFVDDAPVVTSLVNFGGSTAARSGSMFEFTVVNSNDDYRLDWITVKPISGGTNVPEPSTVVLFGSGLMGVGIWRWRKGKNVEVN